MGKVGLFTIVFANKDKIFYPGQPVNGEVQLQVKEEVKIREIRLTFAGFAHVRWSESHGSGKNRRTVTYHSREDYFKEVVPCQSPPHGEEKMMLQPGSYRYPFQFLLPPNVPSSFEGSYGRVRYYVNACMDRPWAFDDEASSYFTVVHLLDLNQLPEAKNPGNAEGSKTLCCLCCESGPITGKHSVDKIGFVPGEAIAIKAECINHSNRELKLTWMELVQVISFITSRKTRRCNTVVQKVVGRSVDKGDSDYWSGQHAVIPPLPASGLVNCNIIDIQYYWQYVCEPSGLAFNLRVPINIIIGGIPLISYAQQYGAPNPMSFGVSDSMYPPPSLYQSSTIGNVPRPAFASFSTQYDDPQGGHGSSVQPGEEAEMERFDPQYPYYNWNQYDTSFKPTTY